MASFYLAPCLKTFRDEVDKAHPNRDRLSDGWLGDVSHTARASDHNPDYGDGGVVRALDVDKDGIYISRLLAVALKNPATNYVIWDGHIYSRAYDFRKRVYSGSNMHRIHLHVSIRHGKIYENRTASWGYSASTPVPALLVAYSPAIKPLQLAVRRTADGRWDASFEKHMNALRSSAGFHGGTHPFGVKFTQLVVGVPQDGVWGPTSIAAHRTTTANVQRALNNLGFKSVVDSKWGAGTEQAYQGARAKY